MRAAARWRWGEPVAPLARLLRRGGLLVIPTESSYGLAADPRSAAGVAAVLRVKGQRGGKPLPVVAASPEQLAELGIDFDLPILARLRRCWPGPLTAVLPLCRPLPASFGGVTLAVRVPGHPRLLRLLAELGTPLTATSANRSGGAPALDAGGSGGAGRRRGRGGGRRRHPSGRSPVDADSLSRRPCV